MLIKREFGLSYSTVHVWRLLGQLGFSSQRPTGRAAQRDEQAIGRWKTRRWPWLKKKAQRERRTIVFIDETEISERPMRVRTWAPIGQTPVLQYSFRWTNLSIVAGITFWRFYFRLFAGAIRGPQFVEFLKALGAQIRGKLLIIWDGLPGHKSRIVRNYVESCGDKFVLETLPPYAPELNPVEYIWAYRKQRELANLCLDTIGQIGAYARSRLKSMQRRPRIITACWQQAELPI